MKYVEFWRVAEFDRETGKCKACGTWIPDRAFVVKVWREVKLENPNLVVIEKQERESSEFSYEELPLQ